jgi:hypothetical protein
MQFYIDYVEENVEKITSTSTCPHVDVDIDGKLPMRHWIDCLPVYTPDSARRVLIR